MVLQTSSKQDCDWVKCAELALTSLVTAGQEASRSDTDSCEEMNRATTSIGRVCHASNSSFGVVI